MMMRVFGLVSKYWNYTFGMRSLCLMHSKPIIPYMSFRNIALPFLTLAVLAGCSGDPVTSLTPTFTAEETARFGKGNPDLVISAIANIVTSSDGTILVADGRAPAVYNFSADGTYNGTVGDYGSEPGNYESAPAISLFENDSLFVWDRSLNRGTIYAKNAGGWEYARHFELSTDAGDGYAISGLSKVTGLEGYITVEAVPGMPSNDGSTDPRYRIIRENGEVISASYLTRKNPELFIDPSRGIVFQMPFGRSSLVRFDDGGEYYLAPWNDKLSIGHFSADGTRLGGIDVNVPVRNVTDADKQLNPQTADPAVAEQLPATHPAFVAFVVADNGNYWVNMGQVEAASTFWAVYSPTGDLLGTTKLPAAVRPARIVNGKIYAASQSSTSQPEIVIYTAPY